MAGAIPLLCPSTAYAFRVVGGDARFDGQPTVSWHADKVELSFSSDDAPVAHEALESAASQSSSSWATTSCLAPSLEVRIGSFAAAAPYDGRNSIEWVTAGWEARGYDAAAPAQTDVQFERSGDGAWQIVEADVYLNADSFSWADEKYNNFIALESVLTHEVGHVLGLLHPCGDDAPSVPVCSADPNFGAAVMNPAYSAERVAPSMDDLGGLCVLYGQKSEDCSSDEDCAESLTCEQGTCRRGSSALGDSCTSHGECVSGACSENVCAVACQEQADCSTDSSCELGQDGVGACVTRLFSIGDSCLQSEECSSQLCVLDEDDEGVCTQRCTADDTCPRNWRCGAPNAEQVCVPSSFKSAGGGACTMAAPKTGSTCAWSLFLAGLCLLRRRSGKTQC